MPDTQPKKTVRLIVPEWQGGQIPAYHLGARLLEALAPTSSVPTYRVPVTPPADATREDTATLHGIDGYTAVVKHLRSARDILEEAQPDAVAILAGDCSGELAPFTYLAKRYITGFGVLWIDAHPDIWTPERNTHFNAMAVSALVGDIGGEVKAALPQTVPETNVHWIGARSEFEPGMRLHDTVRRQLTTADEVNASSSRVLDWIRQRQIRHLAVHVDLDSLDPQDFTLTAVPEPRGVRLQALARLLRDIGDTTDIVGFGVAEHAPRQLEALQAFLESAPLLRQQ